MTKPKTTPQKSAPRARPSDKPTRFLRVRLDFVYAFDHQHDTVPAFLGAAACDVFSNALKEAGEHFPGATHLVPGLLQEVSLDWRPATRAAHEKDLAAERVRETQARAKALDPR